MNVTFKVEHFEGPLDLLLQLVEKEDLDISTISLAAVAEQFVAHVKETPNLPLEDVADFLVVAAKLMYLKSKLLLPSLMDQELEEGPSLEEQLRRYRAFIAASKELNRMWNADAQAFQRVPRPIRRRDVMFAPPDGVTLTLLNGVIQRIVSKIEPLIRLPNAAIERVISIQEKLNHLLRRVREIFKTTFHSFVGTNASRGDVIVSFLALLELTKQRFVSVAQDELFQDIMIEKHPDAPAHDPFEHSFVYET